jgi:hypothetical protein
MCIDWFCILLASTVCVMCVSCSTTGDLDQHTWLLLLIPICLVYSVDGTGTP